MCMIEKLIYKVSGAQIEENGQNKALERVRFFAASALSFCFYPYFLLKGFRQPKEIEIHAAYKVKVGDAYEEALNQSYKFEIQRGPYVGRNLEVRVGGFWPFKDPNYVSIRLPEEIHDLDPAISLSGENSAAELLKNQALAHWQGEGSTELYAKLQKNSLFPLAYKAVEFQCMPITQDELSSRHMEV